jgi:hypothetical protein
MAASERNIADNDEGRRRVIIIAAVAAALIIASVFYLLLRASGTGSNAPVGLQGAVREGSLEFTQFEPRIVLDTPEADEAKRALGDIVMSLHTTARNFTGRTLNGLEVWAAVVDHQGKPIKERTVVVIPARQPELEPNKTLPVQVMLEGMTDADDRANIRMKVTGFRFK